MPVRFRILATSGAAASSPPGAGGPLVERIVEVDGAPAEIRLGRSPDLEVPLPFAALSAVHARLERTPAGGWVVEDARSTNGTWLDGARLAPDERRPLAPGAELRLGNVRVRFEGEGPPAPTAEGTATIARRLVDDLFAASSAEMPTLRVLRGAPSTRLALVEPGRVYLAGRGESCALPLVVEEVSREHASFTRVSAGVVVRDLGSKNGVLVGGARVAGMRVLVDGDVLEIGPVTLQLEDPVGRYLRELESVPVAPAPEPPPAPAAEASASRSSSTSRLALAVSVVAIALIAATVVALLR